MWLLDMAVIDSVSIIAVMSAVSPAATFYNQISTGAPVEIEKVQMWIWKLMDPYHKTNTKVRGVTLKCYEIIQYRTNIVLAPSKLLS